MMLGEMPYNKYVFVTKSNYLSKYALRDRMLKHLASKSNGTDTFGENLLKESSKEIRENLRMMKIAGYLEEWNDITAKISEHGVNFIKQHGYEGLQMQSDEEIVFRFLYDRNGGPVLIDEIKEASGLDYISILDVVDDTSDRIVFRNDDDEVGIKESALDYVGSILINMQFGKLKKNAESNTSTQIGDVYNLQNVSTGQMILGSSNSTVVNDSYNTKQSRPDKKGFWRTIKNIGVLLAGLVSAIVIYTFIETRSCNNAENKQNPTNNKANNSSKDTAAYKINDSKK
jgi:hypothetical protein